MANERYSTKLVAAMHAEVAALSARKAIMANACIDARRSPITDLFFRQAALDLIAARKRLDNYAVRFGKRVHRARQALGETP